MGDFQRALLLPAMEFNKRSAHARFDVMMHLACQHLLQALKHEIGVVRNHAPHRVVRVDKSVPACRVYFPQLSRQPTNNLVRGTVQIRAHARMDSPVGSDGESVDLDVGFQAARQSQDAAYGEVAGLHDVFLLLKRLAGLHIQQSCAPHDAGRGRAICAGDEVEQCVAAVRMCHTEPRGRCARSWTS